MNPKWLRIGAVVVALLGATLLWRSTDLGMDAGATTVRSAGGLQSTMTDPEKQAGYMASLRLMGAVLLGVGLYRALEPHKE